MTPLRPGRAFILAVAMVSACFGDSVAMHLVGIGNGTVMGGVYVNPYVATVGGDETLVVCDDYFAHSYLNEAWTATETHYNTSLSQTKWGSRYGQAKASHLYDEAAWLADRLLDGYRTTPTAAQALNQAHLSFAIWTLFEPTAVNALPTADASAVQALLTAAEAGYHAGAYSNYRIYTPAGRAESPDPPQEFLVRGNTISVRQGHPTGSPLTAVPESPALALFALDGVTAAWAVRRLRKRVS